MSGAKKKARSLTIDRSELKRVEEAFVLSESLGEGTHGDVFRAKEKATGAQFAMKRLNYDPKHERLAMREIKVLRKLRHPNIIHLANVWQDSKGKVVLQLELCRSDFGALLKASRMGGCSLIASLGAAQLKGYLLQIFTAVAFMHENNVIHRDLKPDNILLTHDNVVKITDFGLSREHVQEYHKYTRFMQTLWYRAPEMCMGFDDYTTKADVWSLGCLLGELIYGATMFKGSANSENPRDHDRSQLEKIYELCGTPHPPDWPVDKRQVVRETYKQPIARPFMDTLMKTRDRNRRKSYITNAALDLLDHCFVLLPDKRITCADALQHAYFKSEFPRAYEPWQMCKFRGTESHLNGNVNRKRKK